MAAEHAARRWRAGPGRWRLAVVLAVLLALVPEAEAQRRGGGRRGRSPTPRDPAAKEKPAPEEEYLPGFDAGPAEKGKAKKPAPPAKPPGPKPPDPMAEADAVTALADHRTRLAEAEARLLQEHFRLCDLDDNGWISLREAEAALDIDRGEYRRLDADQDGRLDAGEFARESQGLLARLGALPQAASVVEQKEPPARPEPELVAPPAAPPAPVPQAPAPSEPRSEFGAMTVKPGALVRHFDADSSGGLDPAELEEVVAEIGLSLSATQALEVLDRNDSGQLESKEIFAFAWLASRARPAPEPEPASAPETEPAPAETLAPAPEPKAEAEGGPGRGSHFARLDPGRDGYIDEADLRTLQSPARLDLRIRAVISALDRDGDGRLSEAEFRSAMGVGPR